MQTEEEVEIKL